MGSASSKPARSAAQAVSRRQYPKQPSMTTPPPRAAPPKAAPPQAAPTAAAPVRPPPNAPQPTPQGPTYHSKEPPSTVKSNAIDLDGRDPDFAASLRRIGPVTPAPTLSTTSTFSSSHPAPPSGSPVQTVFPTAANPALLVFTSRQRVTKAAEQEADAVGLPSFAGREFLDAFTIRQALSMRDRQGLPEGEIEQMLRLKKGVLGKLGGKGLVGDVVL
ncbi:hypothetical protein FE257_012287 [Aspergillus nanangensis]|uniref:Helix-turn-helix domain-containing protein n=1 Tax=Aspergillus nanangensis TaxID=2582783 RepID=A0AAD4CFZ7_ASPNN|nr:hypothetical protein FE257_012287 [Aspergillus nanangensis]